MSKRVRRRQTGKRVKTLECHHYQDISYQMRGYGFNMYLCNSCFNGLLNLMNQMLLTMTEEDRLHVSKLGIYCSACQRRGIGSYFLVRETKIKKIEDINEAGEKIDTFTLSSKETTYCYCKSCFNRMTKTGLIVTTSRDIYIPPEVSDRVVKTLYGDRLERTNKIFTIVPTKVLAKLVNSLTDKQKAELQQAMLPANVDLKRAEQ